MLRDIEPQRHRGTEINGLNMITGKIVDAAFEVHKTLGPGLLESLYETCLSYELEQRQLNFKRQIPVPVSYKTLQFNQGFRLDFLVENSIVLELKATDTILPVHEAQIITYMKLTNAPIGLILNFNVPVIKNGIRRFRL